jgi:hypothetical protein
MVMIVVRRFFQLRHVHKFREIIEVEHGVILAVFAKERNVFAKVHVLQMVCNEAPVAALNAFGENPQNFRICICIHHAK